MVSYTATGTSTSESYYYVDERPKSATILESNSPSQTWHDVSKIMWEGQTYKLGDIVTLEHKLAMAFKIIEFKPSSCIVRYLSSSKYSEKPYGHIRLLSDKEAKSVVLDPNTAFRFKKRNGRF
jgi:hypothetical protein